ncbi:class I SAM-dependent methyltransferase [Gracilibacillus caseinilyticus]|uniref:Class I SAM-dependent methyltransferase n=1 Tax=Gracilibacillus caseinilyticus TaxID=2932256 RepID=A0ABY4ESH3_9BACI|nr:class I SAM-dependent methyltransferase [Gracilibacillus caseinilyticus]UOQ47380.1 class I SAM-dependent methyltransferase [Gracilibacillus caseinilyticus]
MNNPIESVFDQLASIYENSVDTDSLYNTEYERPAMMNLLPKKMDGLKVLDAGCAAGWYTKTLLQRGAEVIAIDVSKQMVEAAKRRVGDQADIRQLSLAEPLPFEQDRFHYVISSLTLHYLEEWQPTFREFSRILKPGGKLLYSIHHPLTEIRLAEQPDYFSVEAYIDQWKKQGESFQVPMYRRPLQRVINDTIRYFKLDQVIEPLPTDVFKQRFPDKYKKIRKQPNFLMVQSSVIPDNDSKA